MLQQKKGKVKNEISENYEDVVNWSAFITTGCAIRILTRGPRFYCPEDKEITFSLNRDVPRYSMFRLSVILYVGEFNYNSRVRVYHRLVYSLVWWFGFCA